MTFRAGEMRALLILLLAVAAGPVLAQEAPPTAPPPVAAQTPTPQTPPTEPAPPEASDPLADLITQSGSQSTDEEEPVDTATPAPHRPTVLPIPAPESPSPTGESLDAEGHAIPQGRYIPTAEAYDLRIKSSILAAQGLQGPMDGGWAVLDGDGRELYTLQIADPPGGSGAPEGAWRDIRRPGAVGSTGLIDSVDRSTGALVARFTPRPGRPSWVSLRPDGSGDWSGVLVEDGYETPVSARRLPQATLPPGYAPAGRGPVIWPAPRPAVARIAEPPKRVVACSTKGKTGKALKAAKAKCAAALKKGGKAKGKATAAKGKKGAKGKATAAKKKKTKR